jgi:glutamate-1-semialdehyde 2,1-aminomutase
MSFIVRLANADLASNINIEIFTNGTWYPEKLEHDALMRFKSISITVSLDGIGKLNDIMRYPSKWNDLESTISRWLELCNSHNHVIINIAPTINVINVAYMYELLEWASTHGINVITQTVFEPHHLSVTHWPNWFKRNLKELIDNQYQDSTAKKFKDMWDLISKMCKNNPLETVDHSNEYIENIERLNSHRGFTLADTPLFKRLVDAK